MGLTNPPSQREEKHPPQRPLSSVAVAGKSRRCGRRADARPGAKESQPSAPPGK